MRVIALLGAVLWGLAGPAGATTYEFTSVHGPVSAVLGDGYVVIPWRDGAPDPDAMIAAPGDGLRLTRPWDVAPAPGGEAIRVAFEEAVRLDRITLTDFAGAELWLDDVLVGAAGAVIEVGREVTSFAVRGPVPGAFGLRSFEAQATVAPLPAPIPAPAAGPLLLAGLGGLWWARRRRA
jgi:hypothetical protein